MSGTGLSDNAASAGLGPIIERLRAEPGYLGARLRARATSKLRRVLVFVDQLEELYTLGALPDERAAFLACLAAVADDAASPLRVVLSMRSDFLDRLTEDRRLGAEVTRGLVLLPPMDRDGMREALLAPVEAAEHRFESATMVDRMVDALAATPGALPLLQFTAARLWELRDTGRRMLTEQSYAEASAAWPARWPRTRTRCWRACRPRGRPRPGACSSAWSRPSAPAPWRAWPSCAHCIGIPTPWPTSSSTLPPCVW